LNWIAAYSSSMAAQPVTVWCANSHTSWRETRYIEIAPSRSP